MLNEKDRPRCVHLARSLHDIVQRAFKQLELELPADVSHAPSNRIPKRERSYTDFPIPISSIAELEPLDVLDRMVQSGAPMRKKRKLGHTSNVRDVSGEEKEEVLEEEEETDEDDEEEEINEDGEDKDTEATEPETDMAGNPADRHSVLEPVQQAEFGPIHNQRNDRRSPFQAKETGEVAENGNLAGDQRAVDRADKAARVADAASKSSSSALQGDRLDVHARKALSRETNSVDLPKNPFDKGCVIEQRAMDFVKWLSKDTLKAKALRGKASHDINFTEDEAVLVTNHLFAYLLDQSIPRIGKIIKAYHRAKHDKVHVHSERAKQASLDDQYLGEVRELFNRFHHVYRSTPMSRKGTSELCAYYHLVDHVELFRQYQVCMDILQCQTHKLHNSFYKLMSDRGIHRKPGWGLTTLVNEFVGSVIGVSGSKIGEIYRAAKPIGWLTEAYGNGIVLLLHPSSLRTFRRLGHVKMRHAIEHFKDVMGDTCLGELCALLEVHICTRIREGREISISADQPSKFASFAEHVKAIAMS